MPPCGKLVTLALLLPAACSTFLWQPVPTTQLDGYRAAFTAAAGDRLQASLSREQMVHRLGGEALLWLGDQHRSSRLHALQSELLEDLQRAGVPMALALEAIGEQDLEMVRRYLAGDLSMEQLCSAMRGRWRGSWLDDSDLDPWFYRSLLAFARRTATPVFALEPTPRRPLAERDERIAAAVRTAVAAEPKRLLVVVVGQAHLLGEGALIARTGGTGLAIGGEPPPRLRDAATGNTARGRFSQSDSGLWWFDELLPRNDR